MELEEIKRYVTESLTFSGIERKDLEVQVYEALHHLLTAMKLYDLMDTENRAFVSELVKVKINYFLNVKVMIKPSAKERKRNKEKKIIPPDPLLKEKEKKEKAEKVYISVCDAKEAFRKECFAFDGQYDTQLVMNFYNYYSLVNPKTGRMHFEEEKYWDTKQKLDLWVANPISAEITAAAERARKSRKKAAKEQAETAQQREQAARREEANAELERQIEQSKAGAVSYEEWEAMKKQREKENNGLNG